MTDHPDLPPAVRLLTEAPTATDFHVVMDYDARLMRRKRLRTQEGPGFMVDLPAVTNLDEYWGFELEDGRNVRIVAAEEAVLVITGDLPRLSWHIGNRHTPCEIHEDHLLIREDHVLERMLKGLGAGINRAARPFAPESGAYGTGRTMGHDHGPADHVHAHNHAPHDHNHGHDHHHGHSHDHVHGHDRGTTDHAHGHDHGETDHNHGHQHPDHVHDRHAGVVHHHGAQFHAPDPDPTPETEEKTAS